MKRYRITGLLCLLMVLGLPVLYVRIQQQQLAQKLVRLHIIANSDSPEDQQLKLKVRDYVIGEYGEKLEDSQSIEDTRQWLGQHLTEIKDDVQQFVRGEGEDYTVEAVLEKRYFSVKTYGAMALPKGTYETLAIDLGAAQGENWWCVLYPPLCLVDGCVTYVPETSENGLKAQLDAPAYELITEDMTEEIPVKIESGLWNAIKNILEDKG